MSLKFVVLHSLDRSQQFLKNVSTSQFLKNVSIYVSTQNVFPSEWKNGNIVSIHKKTTNKHWKSPVQYGYSLFVEKFLNY